MVGCINLTHPPGIIQELWDAVACAEKSPSAAPSLVMLVPVGKLKLNFFTCQSDPAVGVGGENAFAKVWECDTTKAVTIPALIWRCELKDSGVAGGFGRDGRL